MVPQPKHIPQIIAEVNRRASSDETLEDVLTIGIFLVAMFGYGTGRNAIPGLKHLSKKSYPEYSIKPGYSWVRRLMKIAMDPKISDEANAKHLPSARSSLEEICRMTDDRFAQGIRPRPVRSWHHRHHPPAGTTCAFTALPPTRIGCCL